MEASDSKTFLTDFRGKSAPEPLLSALTRFIAELHTKIEAPVKQRESDYLKAFRYQLHKICAQLKELKRKTDEHKLTMKRDREIAELQNSLKWFKDESIALPVHLKSNKKEPENGKSKRIPTQEKRPART